MQAQIGRQTPTATVEAYVRGEPQPVRIQLDDYRGHWVVLFFYPRDFTFVCPTEIQAYAQLHAAFATEDAALLAASTDSFYSHKAWYETDERLAAVTFPVVADTTHELARAYGVLNGDGAALRGTFVIDPEGVLRSAVVHDLDVGRNADETLRVLQALRTGALCPAGWRVGQPTLETVPA